MEELDFHVIVERDHTFQNPTSEAKLDQLIDACGLTDGARVLDVGCGKAWLLRRMAATHAIEGVGLELRAAFLAEARAALERDPNRGRITLVEGPAADYRAPPGSFDVGLCIGASFAIGAFEDLLAWLKPFVRPGGVVAIGDIYARRAGIPPQSASHFGGGAVRTLVDTVDQLQAAGLSTTGLIASSDDDWDRYESLHWRAAEAWLAANPDHPQRARFRQRSDAHRRDHLLHDRDALGWAIFICRQPDAR